MFRLALLTCVTVVVVACGGASSSKPAVNPWREDLRVLTDTLAHEHAHAFARVDEPTWRAEVAKVDATIASLDDAHATVALVRLVAMLGDSHTRLAIPHERAFPIAFLWFDDGIFVGGAAATDAVGKRVTALGGRPIDAALAALTPLVAAENDASRRDQLPALLADPIALAGTDLAPTVTLEDGRELVLAPGPAVALQPPATRPLHLQGPTQLFYWNTYVEADHLLYFQYNACADDPRVGPFGTFAASTLAFVDQHRVDRFVLDLRSNGGGNSAIIAPLLDGLVQRPALAGRIFVLIGRATFSSGMLNAIEAKQRLAATLVGTPTGGNPNGYGEVKQFTLPHSHLVGQYSTKLFSNVTYPGTTVPPDQLVHVTSADWFGGRDPAMDAVLATPLPAR